MSARFRFGVFTTFITMVLCGATWSDTAIAAVSAEEAKQLGGATLTKWGAEKAGNKEGTIPAYTGERPKLPPNYNPMEPGNYPDPYASEKPLFSISAQNLTRYAGILTEGQKAMFRKYPDYRMDIYPSHRTVAYAPYVIENIEKNATSCKAVDNELKLSGCYGGLPFPIPKTGNEAIWNHVMSQPVHIWTGPVRTYIVDANGNLVLQAQYNITQEAPYLDPELAGKPLGAKSYYWKLRFDAVAPARKNGEKYIILDSLDPIDPGRRSWSYIPGQRRVKLAPDLAYDTPSPASGGSSTMDEGRIFMGAQDRYDFKLMGKKEVFMPYNNFRITDYHVCPNEVSHTKHFLNPDCLRWETHRAWVVEARLKSGFRHVLPRRMLYFDEDSWGGGFGDSWDASGNIYRHDISVSFPYLNVPYSGVDVGPVVTYDLQTGIYSSTAGLAFPGGGYTPGKPAGFNSDFAFSPEALAGEGIR